MQNSGDIALIIRALRGAVDFRPTAAGVVVAVAVIAYLSLALHQYRLPGLYYDEAADVVPAMQLLQDDPVDLHRGVGINLFGRELPVMIGDYWGVTSTYAVLPLFAIFGIDVFAVRLFPIAACGIAIILTYRLGRSIVDASVGALAALLLAVSPTYIFWSRIGIYVIAHIVAITLGVMLAYLTWRKRPARWKLLAGGLLAGVGLTTKLLFIWFFIAIPAAYLVLLIYDWINARGLTRPRCSIADMPAFVRAHLKRYLPFRSPMDAVVLATGFVIGAFPVIYFNLVSRGSYYLLRSNLGQTERGVDNRAVISNLHHQLSELQVFLDGGYFWFLGEVHTNSTSTYLTGLSLIGLALITLLPEYKRYRRPVVFLYAYAATIFVLSGFSISILAATHLFILLPIPQIVIAAFVVLSTRALTRRVSERRAAMAVVALIWLCVIGYVALELRTDLRYHDTLAETGGAYVFSDAIYDLALYLDANEYERPYALDWGLRANTVLLTEGRVTPLEIYGQTAEPGPEFEQTIRGILSSDARPVFISQTEVSEAFPRLERFRELVAASNRVVVREQVFFQRNGVPAFYVFIVQ